MIDVKNLTKRFGHVLAVDNVSFHVDKGSIVGFLGPNAAGKSTTLKILTCFLPATSGTATVAGHDVLRESLAVRQNVGYMPETVPVYPEMRVREYLMFRAALRDIPRNRRKFAIDKVAKRCWLSEPEDMMRRRLGELSRGYKQRVGLAEVLLHDPEVLILDEPTIGLDPAQIIAMRELILSLRGSHTVILSSHILAEVEQTCDHLIVIAAGRIAAAGTTEQLRRSITGPSRIVAELKGDTEAILKAVRALPGVHEAKHSTHGNWLRVVVQGDEDTDHRAAVAKLAAQNSWPLRELRKEIGSLEDFFIQITYEQNLQAGGRPAESA